MMSDLAELIKQDLSVPSRCYFYGDTTLGGSDACRPELQEDGSIILRSLNLSHVAYRVTEQAYRELRKYPKRKIGIWDFVSEDDQDADHIAAATRYPQSAGRRIGDLERAISAKEAEAVTLRRERDLLRQALQRYGDKTRMSFAEPPELQQVIDAALSATSPTLPVGGSDE